MESNRQQRRRKHQLVASSSLLIIILAAATLLSTKDEAWQLRSYYSANNSSSSATASSSSYEPLIIKSAGLPDFGYSSSRTNKLMNNRTNDFYDSSSRRYAYDSIDQDDDDDDDDDAAAGRGLDDDLSNAMSFNDAEEAMLNNGDNDNFSDNPSENLTGNITLNNSINAAASSPVCHPHFNLALPNNRWNNNATNKFKRIYFYHARKAGGTSLHRYLGEVARHYGIELKAVEWSRMEEPGTNFDDGATFYVTHLREPVARSISHFKYQGRWNCHDLIKGFDIGRSRGRGSFVPTEENANKLETWNQTGGFEPYECPMRGPRKERKHMFFMGNCAVNCYTQWFSGICPHVEMSLEQKFQLARRKLFKYNFVLVIEKLSDPRYVQAVEDFFGVTGILTRGRAYCERQSHLANEKVPLIVQDETIDKLTKLNQLDIKLYREFSDCLDSGGYNNFPKWNEKRFELHSYNEAAAKAAIKDAKAERLEIKAAAKAEKDAPSQRRRALSLKASTTSPERNNVFGFKQKMFQKGAKRKISG